MKTELIKIDDYDNAKVYFEKAIYCSASPGDYIITLFIDDRDFEWTFRDRKKASDAYDTAVQMAFNYKKIEGLK